MRYLVTGGCGFIGSNLAAEVLKHIFKHNQPTICISHHKNSIYKLYVDKI